MSTAHAHGERNVRSAPASSGAQRKGKGGQRVSNMREMYKWRKMTPAQREETLRERQDTRLPWHAPPHFGTERNVYILTGACYEHKPILATPARRDEWQDALLCVLDEAKADVRAWVVLPNHWHVLACVELPALRPLVGRLNNAKSSVWNRQDGTAGRKVWHGFSDRRIRNDRHYFATINYIHANPVKHGYVKDSREWPWSSLDIYLAEMGRDTLREWWNEYPVGEYGRGWDEF